MRYWSGSAQSEGGACIASFGQEALWIMHHLDSERTLYNVPFYFRIRGPFRVDAFEGAIRHIVMRHDVLRTAFTRKFDKVFQVVSSQSHSDFEVVNLEDCTISQRAAETERWIASEHRTTFALDAPPLFRVRILRLSAEHHVLCVTMHHIITDGWSSAVFARELSFFYGQLLRHPSCSLPSLPLQYADYAKLQRDRLQGKVLEDHLSYWKMQLATAPPRLALPMMRRRSTNEHRGRMVEFGIEDAISHAVRDFVLHAKVTTHAFYLAIFKLLLFKYTQVADLSVGTWVAGRTSTNTEGLLGYFTNAVVIRTRFSPERGFLEFLSLVWNTALDAYAHSELPFHILVDELDVDRSESHHPIFQVGFLSRKAVRLDLANAAVENIQPTRLRVQFDLLFALIEGTTSSSDIRCQIEYDSEILESQMIEQMVEHYRVLMREALANPTLPIRDLGVATEWQQRQLARVAKARALGSQVPRECIHRRFEKQAEESPHALAAVCGAEELSYRELNRRANQLAHYLRRIGVGIETPVGICVDRSLNRLIGLLGILKAGGAYLPLHRSDPQDRQRFLMEDGRVEILLTQDSLAERLGHDDPWRTVCLDSEAETWSNESEDNLVDGPTCVNTAYITYTSGTTGKPKGVEVLHQGIMSLLFGVSYADFHAGQTFLHLAPLSFDASTFEIWGGLLHGGKCILAPEGEALTPQQLGAIISKHKVNTLLLTTSLFNAIIDDLPEALGSIRQLVIGGEALSLWHVRRALKALPDTEIVNGYGPCECTTLAMAYRIPRNLPAMLHSVPIGYPLESTQIHILDAHLHGVPIGVQGEIYVAGSGLARGYRNRPDLTAERFVANPFGEAGSRMYRTGDIGRYRADGSVEFLGRVDSQVKVRGFRVELGEIENTLMRVAGVSKAVVIAREDRSGQQRLMAYIVGASGALLDADHLRAEVQSCLPSYMVPTTWTFLAELPLTRNGKVDFERLPLPRHPDLRHAPGARTPVEELLSAIWREVLDIEEIGVDDDFFALGGNSLDAMRIAARVELSLSLEVTVQTIFDNPTIASLALSLKDTSRTSKTLV